MKISGGQHLGKAASLKRPIIVSDRELWVTALEVQYGITIQGGSPLDASRMGLF